MIAAQYITLSELQRRVRQVLEERFALPLWVSAEIAEVKVNYSGHCYLELVEKGEGDGVPKAQARAVIWRSQYARIAAYFEAETGKRYRTDPFTTAKQDNGDGGLSCLQLDTGDDGTAVCHVRIVAGVLYNCAQGGVFHPFGSGDRECDLFSGRERDATCGLYRLAQESD